MREKNVFVRRVLLISIFLFFALVLMPKVVNADQSWNISATSYDYVTATLYDDGELVISGTGAMKDWTSDTKPEWYSYRKQIKNVSITSGVTSIGNKAFLGCSSLTKIEIPNSVISIGSCSFLYCNNLINIKIPEGVTKVGDNAFNECSSLTSIIIPDSVTSIEYCAFCNCSSLTSINVDENNNKYLSKDGILYSKDKRELIVCPQKIKLTSIEILDNTTIIKYSAFSGCSSLTSINIPNSVTRIDSSAFRCCSSLTSIEIPNSVTSIGDWAFENCSSLTTIVVGKDNPNYLSMEGILYNKDITELICCPPKTNLTKIIIPDTVKIIESYALDCKSISRIIIKDNIEIIQDNAFEQSIQIWCYKNSKADEYAKEKGMDVFYLDDLTNPDQLDSLIAEWDISKNNDKSLWASFYDDGRLVISGKGKMKDWIYYNYNSNESNPWYSKKDQIKAVDIKLGVTSIGNYAFEECSNLTSITIPRSVKSIGSYVFYECSSLANIEIPSSVTGIGNYAFADCSSLMHIDIPIGVTSIGEGVFWCCSSLASIEIPSSVKSLGESVFYECSSLTSITIPSSVTSIEMYAFECCNNLTSITIPSSVTSIDGSAFDKCNNLTIYCRRNSYAETYANKNNISKDYFYYLTINPNGGTYTSKDGKEHQTDNWTKIFICNQSNEPIEFANEVYNSEKKCESIPERIGYSLLGWNTTKGTVSKNENGYIFTPDSEEDVTVTAQWRENELTIYYYPNGGEVIITNNDEWEWQTSGDYEQSGKNIVKYTNAENKDIWNVIDVFKRVGYHIENDNSAWTTKPEEPENEKFWITQGKNDFTKLIENGDAELKLYANWNLNTLKLYFYPNGGKQGGTDSHSGNVIESGEYAGASTMVQTIKYTDTDIENKNIWNVLSMFNRMGYHIDEEDAWRVDSPSATETLTQGNKNLKNLLSTQGNQVKKLYANWKPDTYTVKYDLKGGNETIENQTKIQDQTLILSTTIPTKKGYDFKGWATEDNLDQVKYYAGAEFTEEKDMTLYAVWKVKTCNLTIDPAGGKMLLPKEDDSAAIVTNEAYSNLQFTYGTKRLFMKTACTAITIDPQTAWLGTHSGQAINGDNLMIRDGYKFKGWKIVSGEGQIIDEITNDVEKGTIHNYFFDGNCEEDVVIQAEWEPLPTITVDPNGAEISLSTQGPYTEPQTITFYPGNKEKRCFARVGMVSLAGNSQDKWFHFVRMKELTVPYRKGYTFEGWTITEGTGEITEEQDEDGRYSYYYDCSYNGNVTIQAQWKKNESEIVQVTGITVNKTTLSLTKGSNETLTATVAPTNATNKNVTWTSSDTNVATVDSNGKVTAVGAGTATITVKTADGNKTATCEVTVTETTYIIKYNANGGNGTMADTECTYDVTTTLRDNTYTKTGYTFAGWNTKSDGKGTSYSNKARVKNLATSGTVTLYAQWKANTYKIHYNGHGETSGWTAESSHEYDKEKELAENAYKKEYTVTYNYNGNGESNQTSKATYSFDSWNTDPNGKGTKYLDKATVKNLTTVNNETVTIYAQWTGGKVTLLTPTREGYEFKGWATQENSNEVKFNGGADYKVTKDITLYAVWEKVEITIKESAQTIKEVAQIAETKYLIVDKNTKAGEILNDLETNSEEYTLEIKEGEEDADKSKTGQEITIANSEEETNLVIIVKGDVDSDGEVSFIDILKLNNYRLDKELNEKNWKETEKIAFKAVKQSDITDTEINGLTFIDIVALNNYRLGNKK